jgi:hypothetical protein
MVFDVFSDVCLIYGQVRRYPTEGSALSKVMSGMVSFSTTAIAAVLAVTFYMVSEWDLTLLIRFRSDLVPLTLSSWSVWYRRSLRRCCLYDVRSIV